MCFHCVFVTEKPMISMNLKIILVLRINKFVFQLVPTGTPMKVPMFTRLQKQSRHIQEETLPLDTLKWTQTKFLACDVSLFFSLPFCLASCLPLSLSVRSQLSPLHRQNLNLAANKTIFLQEYCSHYDHVNDALYCIFNLDILLP